MRAFSLGFMLRLPFAFASLSPISLRATPTGERIFVDAEGRERLFHGTNVVVKGPPWIPDTSVFSPDISLTEKDFQIMHSLGLNMIRLGTMWPGIEPARGKYNDTYLRELQSITELGAKYGVYTLLDMHQDVLAEAFCGEGIPAWAVKDDQDRHLFKGFPAPLEPPFNRTDSLGFPVRQDCAKHGWTSYHASQAAASGFESLWKNVDGITDAWAAMWGKVVSQFKGAAQILGIELMNEPFAGDFYHDPLIMVPWPDPHNADRVNMQPAYDNISKVVRPIDPDRLVFFAGVTWDDAGVGFDHAPGGQDFANQSVVAYHYYIPPQAGTGHSDLQFDAQLAAARRLKTGWFLTESNPVFDTPNGVSDSADKFLQSWSGWEWKSFCRESAETLAGDSQWAAFGSCKTGYGPVWPQSEEPPHAAVYSRSYPQAVAGETVSFSFNQTTGDFHLEYVLTSVSKSLPTEIYVSPEYHYQKGISVNLTTFPTPNMAKPIYDPQKDPYHVLIQGSTSAPSGTKVIVTILNGLN